MARTFLKCKIDPTYLGSRFPYVSCDVIDGDVPREGIGANILIVENSAASSVSVDSRSGHIGVNLKPRVKCEFETFPDKASPSGSTSYFTCKPSKDNSRDEVLIIDTDDEKFVRGRADHYYTRTRDPEEESDDPEGDAMVDRLNKTMFSVPGGGFGYGSARVRDVQGAANFRRQTRREFYPDYIAREGVIRDFRGNKRGQYQPGRLHANERLAPSFQRSFAWQDAEKGSPGKHRPNYHPSARGRADDEADEYVAVVNDLRDGMNARPRVKIVYDNGWKAEYPVCYDNENTQGSVGFDHPEQLSATTQADAAHACQFVLNGRKDIDQTAATWKRA